MSVLSHKLMEDEKYRRRHPVSLARCRSRLSFLEIGILVAAVVVIMAYREHWGNLFGYLEGLLERGMACL